METQVHLSAKGVELAPEQEELVREAVTGLERFFPRLTACRVDVTVPHRRPKREAVSWTVRLTLVVPRGELAINRQGKPSFREALDDAFAAARRRLQDYAREIRGDVKPRTGECQGRVTRLYGYEGYGFITGEDGNEIYFHRNSVVDGTFDRLTLGAEVRYVETDGEEGPQASTVVLRGQPATTAPASGEVY